tara:strand:- start:237 stop:389 length:153 start_codon:yes stop_codon:yes gene_type:complete
MTKAILLLIIAVMAWQSPEIRHTVADGLDTASEAIRPESDGARFLRELGL